MSGIEFLPPMDQKASKAHRSDERLRNFPRSPMDFQELWKKSIVEFD